MWHKETGFREIIIRSIFPLNIRFISAVYWAISKRCVYIQQSGSGMNKKESTQQVVNSMNYSNSVICFNKIKKKNSVQQRFGVK